MNRESKKVYVDTEQAAFQGCSAVGILFDGLQPEVIYTGKFIYSMALNNKKEKAYTILEDEYDVCFIFNDKIPEFNFYPVPRLEIFAYDSLGGCFSSTSSVDIDEENSPIYYITKNLEIYYLSSNLLKFLKMVVFYPLWRNELGLCNEELVISKQGQEYLSSTLKIKNNGFDYRKNIKREDNIIIYPSLEYAKKEIDFFEVEL